MAHDLTASTLTLSPVLQGPSSPGLFQTRDAAPSPFDRAVQALVGLMVVSFAVSLLATLAQV